MLGLHHILYNNNYKPEIDERDRKLDQTNKRH